MVAPNSYVEPNLKTDSTPVMVQIARLTTGHTNKKLKHHSNSFMTKCLP